MRARKERIPSEAQARALARLWGADMRTNVADTGWRQPTEAAPIKYGWIEATDGRGLFPSGAPYTQYAINEPGIDALEGFLRERRYHRKGAPLTLGAGRG